MKYQISQKAYKIDLTKIDLGFEWAEVITHATTRGKAKAILFDEVRYDGMILKLTDAEVTFLTLPVIRSKENDLYQYGGKELTLGQIEMEKANQKRHAELDALIADKHVRYCYIKKRGSYYRPNYNGYTEFQTFAGVYNCEDAVKHARNVHEITVVPVNEKKHNKLISKRIADLKSRMINQ